MLARSKSQRVFALESKCGRVEVSKSVVIKSCFAVVVLIRESQEIEQKSGAID